MCMSKLKSIKSKKKKKPIVIFQIEWCKSKRILKNVLKSSSRVNVRRSCPPLLFSFSSAKN